MTTGAAIAASDRVVGLTRPAETEKGSLTRLTRKKNQAVVPRKAATEKRDARKYMLVTGPPALATIVVKPAIQPKPADPRAEPRPELAPLGCATGVAAAARDLAAERGPEFERELIHRDALILRKKFRG